VAEKPILDYQSKQPPEKWFTLTDVLVLTFFVLFMLMALIIMGSLLSIFIGPHLSE
jgi:hypothetical protein